MAQHMNSRQQHQSQSGMNQSGNQGMLNHRQGGYGGSTNDNVSQGSQGQQFGTSQQQCGTSQQQCGPSQKQSSVGGQSQVDNTQRSQAGFTGQPIQSQGNMQGNQSIGQRGESLQGAGQQNESVEQARTGFSR